MDQYVSQKSTVDLLRDQEKHTEEREERYLKRRLLFLQVKEMEQKFPDGKSKFFFIFFMYSKLY